MKFVSLIAFLCFLLTGCGGGSSSTTAAATAPSAETSSTQLASSVGLKGFSGLSLAQTQSSQGTQTALLEKLFNWATDTLLPKAYAQTAQQCNYDLLKLAGVTANGVLEQLKVTTGADDCTTGFVDMYDGKKYILLTASGIYKDGLTCNLVLINKADGALYCVGEKSRSIYKISGTDSWKAYEKLQVSEDGNFMFLETDSTVFDHNGQVTGIKTKLIRFDMSNDAVGPVSSTLLEGFQQSWLTGSNFGFNAADFEGFRIKGYQGLNNGDLAILYERSISSSNSWAYKLNAFYYSFNADSTYERVKFDNASINTGLTTSYQAATSSNAGQGSWTGGGAQLNWYDISCFFKDPTDPNSFVFTIPYYYGYSYQSGASWNWVNGVNAVIFKATKPAAGAATMGATVVRGDTAICSESSSMGGGAAMGAAGSGSGSRPSKIGDKYYAIQTSSGWDSGTNSWGSKTYLVSNKFDGSADVKKLVATSTSWFGSKKLFATKDYLFLKSPADGAAWTFNSQPGDNLWRLDPATDFRLTGAGVLDPRDYLSVISSGESISITKLATDSTSNTPKLTGRKLDDPDLLKIVGDITEAGVFVAGTTVNKALQPVSIVKL